MCIRDSRKAVRSRLQLTALCEALSEKNRVVELQHKQGKSGAGYGGLDIEVLDGMSGTCPVSYTHLAIERRISRECLCLSF